LLDEITELKVELQAKLLRTIEEKKLRRMGASNDNETPLDIRLIAASSKSLTDATHQRQAPRGFIFQPQYIHHRVAAAA